MVTKMQSLPVRCESSERAGEGILPPVAASTGQTQLEVRWKGGRRWSPQTEPFREQRDSYPSFFPP